MSHWDLAPEQSLADLFSDWRKAMLTSVTAGTVGMYALHCAQMCKDFATPHAITKGAIANYQRRRLGEVKRKTLQKELGTLRSFLGWALEQRLCITAPEMPGLPRRAKGTPYHVRRRGAATDLEPDDCRRLIAYLPQWSRPRVGAPSFPVRARFIVMFETALRPATLDALSIPEHYTIGADHLEITDAIDKAQYGRRLPLTKLAQEALETVARSGIIFGVHDYRRHLDRAARVALDPNKARTFCSYDLRHARATQLASHGDLPSVAYIMGHKHLTTTNVYIHPKLRHAKKVLDACSRPPTSQPGQLVGIPNTVVIAPNRNRKVRGTGVEPARPCGHQNLNLGLCETQVSGHIAPGHGLESRARSVAERAAAGVPVDNSELYAFARESLGSTELGRLALGVLDGGAFARVRAVELAELILLSATEQASAERDGTE